MESTPCNLSINAALTAFTTLFDANKLGPSIGEGEWADPRRPLQTVHSAIDSRDRDRGAAAAIHLFVEVPENHARSRQKARTRAHDFRDGDVDIAVSYYGA